MRGRRKNSESTAGVRAAGCTFFEPGVDETDPERPMRSRTRWVRLLRNELEVVGPGVEFRLDFDDGKAEEAEEAECVDRRLLALS